MHIIKIKDEELLLVEVPEDSDNYQVFESDLQFYIDTMATHIDLPGAHYEYELLGSIDSGVPDFDVEPYVERFTLIMDYRNYIPNATKNCISAKQSFLSLLASHSIPYKSTKLICLKARK